MIFSFSYLAVSCGKISLRARLVHRNRSYNIIAISDNYSVIWLRFSLLRIAIPSNEE